MRSLGKFAGYVVFFICLTIVGAVITANIVPLVGLAILVGIGTWAAKRVVD